MPRISPFLWFDTQAEPAAQHYVSVFPNSKIVHVARMKDARPNHDSIVTVVAFEIDGLRVVAMNGGPKYKLTEAFSLSIECSTQEEVDHYWSRLSEGGEEGPCGWLKDRFGLSWQVNPRQLGEMLGDPDRAKAGRAMAAMMTMKKIDIAALQRAFEG